MTQDQVFVPKTRSQIPNLPSFDAEKEDALGASIPNKIMNELRDALGESPMGSMFDAATYLVSFDLS